MQNIPKIQIVPSSVVLQINSSHFLLKQRLSVASWAVLYIWWQFPSPTTVLPFTAKGVLCSNINFQFLFSANHFSPTTVNICFLSALLSKKNIHRFGAVQISFPIWNVVEMQLWLRVLEFRLLYCDSRSGKFRHNHA